jgi:hypothetical protein
MNNIMNTKRKGDIGVIKVLEYLLYNGYNVSIPFGDNNRYDLVSEKDGNFTRIQVKNIAKKNGTIKVSGFSLNSNKYENVRKYYTSDEIDEIWVYCMTDGNLYKIPIDRIEGHRCLTIRIDPTKTNNGNNHNYGKDYIVR